MHLCVNSDLMVIKHFRKLVPTKRGTIVNFIHVLLKLTIVQILILQFTMVKKYNIWIIIRIE